MEAVLTQALKRERTHLVVAGQTISITVAGIDRWFVESVDFDVLPRKEKPDDESYETASQATDAGFAIARALLHLPPT